MKAVALSFLVGAAIVYLLCEFSDRHGGAPAWVGYVKAAAEAGMVGGLADWFAVTALFRHPLGLPIPHTAIIRKKKDQLGEALGGFVQQNFLTPEVIAEKVGSLELSGRVAGWMADPANSERLGQEATKLVKVMSEVLRDEDVEQVLNSTIIKRLAEPEWGPPVGRLVETLLQENRHLPLINLLAERAHHWALGSQGLIDKIVDADGPAWSPKFVNSLLGERIYRELVEFTWKVRSDPDHELRHAMSTFLWDFASDLQHDPRTIAKVETAKAELMGREEVRTAAQAAWRTAKRLIEQSVDDPESTLRAKFSESAARFGVRLRDDEALRAKADFWVDRSVRHLVENYSGQIISIITETVARWDADEASKKIELQVGRDLQFIRINGTVVGSIAGLAIYTVTQVLF
ncbi:DUF445 family protein [Tsukamurella sp. 8F]|uniref:DUF445 domain-containing protein n=1 Tax=unclassified Tsukamurella TaxID=2633480 RepID=UPI0023B8F23E|nr:MULTISPECIES: DUF445 family protein [unclassified Tsukamurella]MDF0528308.1 DUF445 family protein [Tsukamurella sp. 8J]MDF0589506.1 DUF445 family protein [Tsukamurella sp. 8F]